jgi:hypothetical protein
VHPGVRHFPWGSGPTVATLEYIVSSGHVVAPEPPTWRVQVLFTTRLELAMRALEREMCPWAISKYFGDLVSNTSA